MNINTRLQTPLRTPMPPCEQLGDLPPDMLAIIHRLLRRADLHSLSLTSPNQQGLTQASKKEWSVWDEQCKKWEYIHGSKWKYGIKDSNPQYPQFYLGIPPSNERQHNKDGAKLRLFIQQRSFLHEDHVRDGESTIIAMDFNPTIIDDLDPRFPGIPIRFNFDKINEKGDIQRVVIGDHRLFLTILYKCKEVLENLTTKTAIWTGEDVLDLEEERQYNRDLKPFPGYVDGHFDDQVNIKANKDKLKETYQQIIDFIKAKIDAHPGEPPGLGAPLSLRKGGNKKIKKKKQTK